MKSTNGRCVGGDESVGGGVEIKNECPEKKIELAQNAFSSKRIFSSASKTMIVKFSQLTSYLSLARENLACTCMCPHSLILQT